MSGSERQVRWPDGASLSVPFPLGRIGGTYYWNPGSPTAPRLTLTRSLGMPGAGAHAVFLRQGMTSNDTLGTGISGNVSTILPSVSLNGTFPDDGNYIPRPWKSRVTTVEAGIGTPNASPAITATYTPQQIADFLTRYILPPPSGPEWKNAFVRDSAESAGVASRNNVFEYGYPESGAMGPDDELSPFARAFRSGVSTVGPVTAPPIRYLSSRHTNPHGNGMSDWKSSVGPVDAPRQAPPGETSPKMGPSGKMPSSDIFTNGAPPTPFLPLASQRVPRGLPAIAEISAFDPSSPEAPPAGGLLGLMQDYLRNNPDAYR